MSAAAHASRPRRKSVLVVDDDADILDSFSDLLTAAGYDCLQACNGSEALQVLARGTSVDLILLDLKLPERSGYEVLEVLRQSDSLLRIPVVVISAYLGLPPAGAVAWLKKPVQPHILLSVIFKHLPE